jgi:hypothetical protein
MSAATLLDRLDRPKQTRSGNWIAGCPCCQSRRGRPISVRDLGGRILLHAFCGCRTEDVLGAIGLQMSDLFEAPLGHHFPASKSQIPARDLIEIISEETNIITTTAADLLDGRFIDEDAWTRLAQAAARIHRARDHFYG